MSKHTPGPWRAFKIPGGVHCVERPDDRAILWSRVRPMGDEVDAANARLIAAAPDMLAALRYARETLGPPMERPPVDATDDAMCRIEDAIAKAQGRAR